METLSNLLSKMHLLINLLRRGDDSPSLQNHVLDKIVDFIYDLDGLCTCYFEKAEKLEELLTCQEQELLRLTEELENLKKSQRRREILDNKLRAIQGLRKYCEEKGRRLGLKETKELIEAIGDGWLIEVINVTGALQQKLMARKVQQAQGEKE